MRGSLSGRAPSAAVVVAMASGLLLIGALMAPAAQASCAAGAATKVSPTSAAAGATVVLTSGEFGDCGDVIINGKVTGKTDAVTVRFQQGGRSAQVGAASVKVADTGLTTIRITVPAWARSGSATIVASSTVSGPHTVAFTVGLPVTGPQPLHWPALLAAVCLLSAAFALTRAQSLRRRIVRLGGPVTS